MSTALVLAPAGIAIAAAATATRATLARAPALLRALRRLPSSSLLRRNRLVALYSSPQRRAFSSLSSSLSSAARSRTGAGAGASVGVSSASAGGMAVRHMSLSQRHPSSPGTSFTRSPMSTGGYDGSVNIRTYPERGRNTIINTCPQGSAMVIERFGKFQRVVQPGLFFAIPLVDQIAYIHDMREMAIRVEPQEAISRDNVTVRLGGTVYVQVVDPKTASYGATRPLYAVVQHAQSALRAAVGLMDLDSLFHARDQLNQNVRKSIEDASNNWGVKVLRFEILEILPDDRIRQAMDLQAVAERERREEILRAEATKRSMELRSEGKRTAEANESEGLRVRMINEGEGEKQRIILAADAEARAILAKATATSEAISTIATALAQANGDRALAYQLAKEYFGAFSTLASGSNTMIIPSNVSDMPAMIAQGVAIVEQVRRATTPSGANAAFAAGTAAANAANTPAHGVDGVTGGIKQSEVMTGDLNRWAGDTKAHPSPANHNATTSRTGGGTTTRTASF